MVCIAAATSGAAASAHTAADRTKEPSTRSVEVGTLGGALQRAQQVAFFAPFTEATHSPVHVTSWDGTLSTLERRIRTASASPDLVLLENVSTLAACHRGLLLPIDPGGLLRPFLIGADHLDGDVLSRCGIGALRTDLVLAWDKSQIDTAPSWADFWDVARRPGKRGLRRDPRGTLEIALLADGVAPEDVYRTLATSDGLDRAFRKLDQLKPYIVWWDSPARAVQIIESGAVLMTSAPNGEVAEANQQGHRDFGIQWQQSVSSMLSWAMPGRPQATGADASPDSQTADRQLRARQLLGFMTDPARQAAFVRLYPAVSIVRNVIPDDQPLPDDSPATPDHRRDSLRQDDGFWDANLVGIKARFETWLGN